MGDIYAADLYILQLVKIVHSLLERGWRYKARADLWLKNTVLIEIYMPILLRVHFVKSCIILYLHKNKFI
jgi:hypothetical protein